MYLFLRGCNAGLRAHAGGRSFRFVCLCCLLLTGFLSAMAMGGGPTTGFPSRLAMPLPDGVIDKSGQVGVNTCQATVKANQTGVNRGQSTVNANQAEVNATQATVSKDQATLNAGQAILNESRSTVNAGVEGVYSGILPCADCEGIVYRLNLRADGSYEEQMVYKGKDPKPFVTRGRYTVEGDSLVKLDKKTPGMNLLRKHPKGLQMLDAEGQPITGVLADQYVLLKLTRGSVAGETPERVRRAFLYKKWKAGVGFVGSGNEPSWGLELNFSKYMRFTTPDGDTMYMSISKPAYAADVNMVRYYARNAKGSLTVQIFQQDCTDGMSDEHYDYKVQVDVQKGSSDDTKHYEGCGRYIPDFRLEGYWVLQTMNGGKVDSVNYPRGFPNMTLKMVGNQFGGMTGCNRMMGKFYNTGYGRLRFGLAATTLMMCPNISKEQDLLDAMKRVDKYRVMGGQLQLTAEGKPFLVFKKSRQVQR